MKDKVISSLIWKFLEKSGTQGIQFILQIILARLLLPEDYGVVAIVTVFITIANVFVQSGFNTALIQKKTVDDTDYSSVFYLSLTVSILLYVFLFFVSPFIASFYDKEILINVIRVLSLTLPLGAINSIQTAVISRTLSFKKYFFGSLISVIISGIIGIILAYLNYGVWAIVIQQLINTSLFTLILWFTVKWRPKLLLSFTRLKVLFKYGSKLLCSSLIDTIYRNIYDLIIGKIYNSSTLAYYNRGKQFPNIIAINIDGTISSVMLPTLSSKQDDKVALKKMVRRAIVTSSFFLFPIMIGLFITAETLVSLVLTDKWLECVPFIQILSISYALWPIHTANLQAINAIGRSDIYLKLEILKKIIGIIVLLITMKYGIYAMAIGQVVTSFTSTFINSYPNKKLLNYSYIEQIKDILPSLLLSIFMGICIYFIKFIFINKILILLFQIILGIIIYFSLAKLLKFECFSYLLNNMKYRRR